MSDGPRTRHLISLPAYIVSLAQSTQDRKSTRLNSSHDQISYAVFCLKKKTEAHRGENATKPRGARDGVTWRALAINERSWRKQAHVVSRYGLRCAERSSSHDVRLRRV